MNLNFSDKKLEKYANNDRMGSKKLGEKRFKKFKQRLDQLKASKTLEDVKSQPGRFHELTSDRKGQWACDLDHPYRLIFEPQENPIPIDNDGKYIWVEIKGVEIIEIDDYH
jgi:proteic killer suppression protein